MKRGHLAVTAIDIDVITAALREAELAANISNDVYETPAHEAAAGRLKVRLAALYRQVTDEVPA